MPPQNPPSPVLRRAAWVLVIIMTVLLALALIAVVWGFIRQGRILMQHRAGERPAATAPALGGGIILPPGAKILSSSTEAGRLVLRLQTRSGGEEVRIVDLSNGRLVQTIKTSP
jgi:hypothetical protein